MEEKRKIGRLDFESKGLIVPCDTEDKIYADIVNVSPSGIAMIVPEDTKELLGMDAVIVADTMIMLATAVRKEFKTGGRVLYGFHTKKITGEVLQSILERMGL